MKLSPSLVAVKKITSAVPCSHFSDDELNQAAQLILEAGGVINPIVLQRNSIESYEVVEGNFEYYAAVKAREIDPRKGEMIGAFIIEPDNEEVFQKQIKLFRKRDGNNKIEQKESFQQQTEVFKNQDGNNKIEQTIKNLAHQLAQVLETVKRIENDLTQQLKPVKTKKANPKKTETKKAEKSGYDSMTVAQLKDKAKELNIKGYSKMTKAQLITALT